MNYIDKEISFAKDLEDKILTHIAHYNDDYINIIRKYHMDEVRSIRSYMSDIIGDTFADARLLNYSFHKAIIDLGIDLNGLLLPKKTEKVSYSRITM